jgi:hypothetical protein
MKELLRMKHNTLGTWFAGLKNPNKPTSGRASSFIVVFTSILIFFSSSDVTAQVIYEDSFSNASSPNQLPLPAPWKSVWPNQWLQDGWLHNEDQNGWPRDSQAVLHDSDPSWRNYEFRATVDILGPWTDATLLMRSQGYSRSSAGSSGRAYELNFSDYSGHGPNFDVVNRIVLARVDCTSGVCINTELANVPLMLGKKGPFDVAAILQDGNIQVSVDGSLVFKVVDTNPINYGGIGIHNIWETHGRYDNFRVTSVVPLPTALPLFFTAIFGMFAFTKRCKSLPLNN